MRKIIAILAISFLIGACAYASEDTGELSTSITIASNFDLELGASWIDFGLAQPGAFSSQKQVSIETVSNTGTDWELRISNDAMNDEATGLLVIPDVNCKAVFYPDDVATGASDYDSDTGSKDNLPGATPDILYNSGAAETGHLYHSLLLYVDVPGEQPAGWYGNTVTILMIEDTP